MTPAALKSFFDRSLEAWPEAALGYRRLDEAVTRDIEIDGFTFTMQHNPGRAVSTNARVDTASISARPCFLCASNRPSPQLSLDVMSGKYHLLVNPFPIMPVHFTIPAVEHTPQLIEGRLDDMRELAGMLPGMAVFYNGALAGASAPDHFHYQAVPQDCLPLLSRIDKAPMLVREINDEDSLLPETPVNIIAWHIDDATRVVAIPRRAHRPSCYRQGRLMVSPGTIDMAGVMVLPRREDFDRITQADVMTIIKEVGYERKR